jgi:hypothetical protein
MPQQVGGRKGSLLLGFPELGKQKLAEFAVVQVNAIG